MDSAEPETPFGAVSAQTSRLGRIYQANLDKLTPFKTYRWIGTGCLFVLFFIRILTAQGWYIVCYTLGIYLLNLFLSFLQPKFLPIAADDGLEDGAVNEPTLPTKQDEEFRPFIRRLPEFQFWHSGTRAILIAFFCSWWEIFNVPVFWPILVLYFIVLFTLTMRRQIEHMIKYRYVPFTIGKAKYNAANAG